MSFFRDKPPRNKFGTGNPVEISARSVEQLAPIVIRQQVSQLRKALLELSKTIENPLPGSSVASDWEWIREHKDIDLVAGAYMMGAESAAAFLDSARQQSQALQILFESGCELPLPAMGNVRAIHEVVLKLCWLYDPKITSEKRIVRSSAVFLQAVQGGIPIMKSFPTEMLPNLKITAALESRDGAIEALESIGMVVKRKTDSGKAQNVRWGNHVENIDVKYTDMSLKYTPKSHYLYALNSAAVHSQSWLVESKSPSWETSLKSIVLAILDLSDALVDSIFGYLGIDTEDLHRDTDNRRRALLHSRSRDES